MIMPIGIIEQSTGDGATFKLTRPGDHSNLKINSPVVVLKAQIDQQDFISGVMVRGQVTEIGLTTANFATVEYWADPNWPKDTDILVPGNFVHLALPNSFELDPTQIATQEETEFLEKLEMDREKNDSGPA